MNKKKMADLSHNVFIINNFLNVNFLKFLLLFNYSCMPLNVNVLKTLIGRQRLSEWIKNMLL